ncbi:MAG: hypothetical protein AB1543_08115 [Candidatus Bipolaricaulota bacterium]
MKRRAEAKWIGAVATRVMRPSPCVTIALMSLLLTSCTQPAESTQDSTSALIAASFLAQEPCGPPCFPGIVPGLTREAEVEGILRQLRIDEDCEAHNTEEEGGGRGLVCGGFVVGYRPGSDIVELVGFSAPPGMRVQDLIAIYGPPRSALAGPQGIPEFPRTGMTLFYPEIGVEVALPTQEGTVYTLEPSTLVSGVSYLDADSFARDWGPELPTWAGYGEYRQTEFFHSR